MPACRRSRRIVSGLFLAFLCTVRDERGLLAAQGPAPDAAGAARGLQEVTIDVTGRTVTGILPFDVPFQLRGPLPADALSMDVAILYRDGTPVTIPDGAILRWERVRGIAAEQFRLIIPPLDAERDYRFRLSFRMRVGEERTAAYMREARQGVDELLRGCGGTQTREQVTELNEELVRLLRLTLEDSETLELDALLGAGSDEARARLFPDGLQTILTAQDDRRRVLTLYQTQQAQLARDLETIRSDPVINKVHADLRRMAEEDDNVATLLQNEGFGLLTEEDGDSAARALGRRLGGTTSGTFFKDVYDRAGVTRFRDSFGETGRWREALAAGIDPREGELVRRLLSEAEVDQLSRTIDSGAFATAAGTLFRLGGALSQIQSDLARRADGLDRLLAQVRISVDAAVVVDASTTGAASTHRNSYLAVDAGVLYATQIGTVTPYVGANIYFRPVNKEASLARRGGFWRRFSGTIGVTATEPGRDGDDRLALFGSQALVLGVGYRLTQTVRVGGGGFVFRTPDPNPLIDDTRAVWVPYFSFSFDVDLASILGKAFAAERNEGAYLGGSRGRFRR